MISFVTKRRAVLAALCILMSPTLAAGAAAAACPTEQTVGQGFFLKGNTAKTEVRHLDDHFVQARTRYPDGVVQTDLYYDGLLAVSRFSQRGANMMLGADLKDWRLELKKGAKASLTYIPVADSKPFAETTLELEVKGSETLKLGNCDFEVYVITQTSRTGKKERVYDQLFSALLKFVIARRYPNGDLRAYLGAEAM